MTDRPNILLFITDQHRADYLGCYGHPTLRTPHIDSIAADGTRFDNFFVANPVCMPNRATLMTGRMSTLHGVRHNGLPLSTTARTFADVLRAHGYKTALIGKSHLQNFTDMPAQKGPHPGAGAAIGEAWRTPPGRYDQEQSLHWQSEQPLKLDLPFYGFEHVDLVTGHGDLCGGHYYQWLREQCDDPQRLRGPRNQLAHQYSVPQAWRTAVPEALYPTSYIREQAKTWLRRQADDARPFFCMVSFPDPHHPFTPPGSYWGRHAPADMCLPASFDAHDNPPPHLRWARARLADGTANTRSQTAFSVNRQHAREAMALTCDMIVMIDDAVGELLSTLQALDIDDRTVVAFTADHGDFLGDHGLLLKGPMHFRSLIRVPFIWSDPGQHQVKFAQGLAGTVDIARTVLDRAGVVPYNGMQGVGLAAALQSGETGREFMLVEDEGNRAYLGFDSPPKLRTLVTATHRLSVYLGTQWGELYDLHNDPDETVNLWDDPQRAALKSELTLMLVQQMMENTETSPWPVRVA